MHHLLSRILCTVVIALMAQAQAAAEDKVLFNRDVRPILSENCYLCHGPDKGRRKADMRLDVREVAVKKGAIVPGKPDESELVSRIFAEDEEQRMPPLTTHKKLTAQQKETLKRWIAQGAEYQLHWAYLAPKRPDVPLVKQQDWARTPIDAFILANLEAKKIKPSGQADKRTLLRRLSLDLIGLPPTPEELNAFLKDDSSLAYERVVDRLLASPHYGERMAVPWLDVVRFSDTVGYHGDQNQRIFPYRDYVINAFNQNKPFDQFTLEQLAGDLLPQPTVEQRIATGFNRLNMMTREGGAQPKEYLSKYQADRVRAVSTAWLGATMQCAECHDHKFDPFTAKDFYQMEAFFADVKQWGVYQDYGYTPNPDLRGWSNDHPFPPEIEVESPYLKQRIAKLNAEFAKLAADASKSVTLDDAKWQAFSEWCKTTLPFLLENPSGWSSPEPDVSFGAAPAPKGKGKAPAKPAAKSEEKPKPEEKSEEPKFALQGDRSVLFTGKPEGQPVLGIKLPGGGWVASLKLELVPDASHENSILRGGARNTSFRPAFVLAGHDGKGERPLAIRLADANLKEPIYRNGHDLIGVRESWRTSAKHRTEPHVSVWVLDQPFVAAASDVLLVKLQTNLPGRVRVSYSPVVPEDLTYPDYLTKREGLFELGEEPKSLRKTLAEQMYLRSTGFDPAAFAKLKRLEAELAECRGGTTHTMVTEAMPPITTRVLPRGNWLDETGPVVQPGVPTFLPQPSNGDGRRLTRLDLANWLTTPENPLTARTAMNRLWKQFFGIGLSAVIDDLGAQGEWPVHPELLDWLAVEFRESGWDMKHMVKLIVLSSAYRQEAGPRADLKDIDPLNRLIACQSPRRLEAEFVRDNALAVAGLLVRDLGGPSVTPYQPPGYYSQLQFPDRDYKANTDDRQYRRGVYMHWQRTFLQPMLANFDAPSREECTANRTVANTPQQALTLLNDPSFVEAARVFATRLLASEAKEDGERLERAFVRALGRAAKAKEKQSLLAFLASQRDHYRANAEDAKKLLHIGIAPLPAGVNEPELAAWTSVMRVILNLYETITRY